MRPGDERGDGGHGSLFLRFLAETFIEAKTCARCILVSLRFLRFLAETFIEAGWVLGDGFFFDEISSLSSGDFH